MKRNKLFVTALGEVYRGQKHLECSCLDTLSLSEFNLVKTIWSFQSIEDGRFRVYGGIKTTGTQEINLVTEFCNWVDQKDFWKTLDRLKRETKARLWVMKESERSNHYSPPQGIEGEVINPDREPTELGPWVFGPNHGRMEKQVEFSWKVTSMNLDQLRAFKEEMAKATQEIWDTQGVCVS